MATTAAEPITQKRFHRVNKALIAHSVPLAGCERMPFLMAACLAVVPIAGTGVTHFQVDLFSLVVFFPLWGIARLLYIHDPRSAAKLLGHLAWKYETYTARRPYAQRALANRRSGKVHEITSKLWAMMTRSLRS